MKTSSTTVALHDSFHEDRRSASAAVSPPAAGPSRRPAPKRRSAPAGRVAADAAAASRGLDGDGDGGGGGTGRLSFFCPLPRRGLFHSRAYREHRKKRREARERGEAPRDRDIPLQRDLTRRKRRSYSNSKAKLHRILYEATNVAEFYRAKVESEKDERPLVVPSGDQRWGEGDGGDAEPEPDITLVGRDGAEVRAARVTLARHSAVLREVFSQDRPCPHYDAESAMLRLDFCGRDALAALVRYCRQGDLPPTFPLTTATEAAARRLAQLDRLARSYEFVALGELTYRALRKLVNQRAVLACAIFDELQDGARGAVAARPVVPVDSIERYALDTLRELPMDTLLAGGVQWMREAAIEAIMQDQDIEVDEFFMYKILQAWVGRRDERLPVARRLASNIELKFIDVDLLETQIAESGYFRDKQIKETIRLINDSLADRNPSEMERVLVEGCGSPHVNGIYCRVEQELGLGEEEILFVKETDTGMDEMGLYLYGTKWQIAPCMDYSNSYYSCEEPPGGSPAGVLVPPSGWSVEYGGSAPAPYCLYLPVTRLGRGARLVAPNLEEMLDPSRAEKRRSQYFDTRAEDRGEKRTMTLEQMMNLPEDREDMV